MSDRSYSPAPSYTKRDDKAETSSSRAPYHPISKQTFTSIEFPSTVSHPSAIFKVVSQDDINECFNDPVTQHASLEMYFNRDDSSANPVRGSRIEGRKLVLRVIKRRRRRPLADGEQPAVAKAKARATEGVFTAEVVGLVQQTVRFRAMADWHYTPNPDSRVMQIANSLKELDYNAILEYAVPPFRETWVEPIPPEDASLYDPGVHERSILELHPPPMFSDRKVPFVYNFKNANQAVIEEWEDPRTGEVKKRYVNKGRQTFFAPERIGHGHAPGEVPKEPVKGTKDLMAKLDQKLLGKLQQSFQERPVWLRHSLLNQFTEDEQRIIKSARKYLPAVCYTLGAGPFWKCYVRFGYDPCIEPSARIYQRIYFYVNVVRRTNNPLTLDLPPPEDDEDDGGEGKKDRSWWEAEQEQLIAEGKRPPLDPSRTHIFDGRLIHTDHPDYQLCDVTDPMIRKYIDDPENVADTCDPQNGWYKPAVYDFIKNMTRIKYIYVRERCEPAPDSICYDALADYQRGLMQRDEEKGDRESENGLQKDVAMEA